ncbi:hypothetical protein CYMTET_3723 [Cymbomonas tetramitiformis]|uniref:Uncharacterized protein n=1 Tax=Cymbomonas tetramitiformis TaxID=36881 RepID=A0AAE0H331_9CHLO|nr:hypothetical protein CYMTET_3723 [Cymbomonas tetramitiformis]
MILEKRGAGGMAQRGARTQAAGVPLSPGEPALHEGLVSPPVPDGLVGLLSTPGGARGSLVDAVEMTEVASPESSGPMADVLGSREWSSRSDVEYLWEDGQMHGAGKAERLALLSLAPSAPERRADERNWMEALERGLERPEQVAIWGEGTFLGNDEWTIHPVREGVLTLVEMAFQSAQGAGGGARMRRRRCRQKLSGRCMTRWRRTTEAGPDPAPLGCAPLDVSTAVTAAAAARTAEGTACAAGGAAAVATEGAAAAATAAAIAATNMGGMGSGGSGNSSTNNSSNNMGGRRSGGSSSGERGEVLCRDCDECGGGAAAHDVDPPPGEDDPAFRCHVLGEDRRAPDADGPPLAAGTPA